MALAVVSFVPFWVFRAQAHFLGDGYLCLRSLVSGHQFKLTGLLDLFLHARLFHVMKGASEADAAVVYALVSAIGGVFFVFVLLWFSDFLGKDRWKAALVFSLMMSMGTVQLFFGYVESYTLMSVGVLIYLLFSCYHLKGRCSILFPSLALSLTICCHLTAVALFPSLIYLFLASAKRKHRSSNWLLFAKMSGTFVVPILLSAALIILSGRSMIELLAGAESDVFLSLGSSTAQPPYTLFSPAHLVDMVNEHLLISPVGLILCLLLFIGYRREINFKRPLIRFFIIASGFCFLSTFVLNPKIGPSRDWDLLSLPSIPYTLLGAYLLIGCVRNRRRLKSIGLTLTVVALVHTIPWILVNADADKAIKRFKLLISTKSLRSQSYAHEELAIYYRDVGLLDEAIEEYRRALAVSPDNVRLHLSLGLTCWEKKMYDEAIQQYQKAVAILPNLARARFDLGSLYVHKKMYHEAIQQYEQVIAIDPKFDLAHYNLGILYQERKLFDQAIQEFKKAIAIKPNDADFHFILGCAYEQQGRWPEAKAEWRRTLELNPNHQRARERLQGLSRH
ncbi:tetratricopeptide repeat protein [bacterium]|nr:tetratricopeptide repeat protein [bacterium]